MDKYPEVKQIAMLFSDPTRSHIVDVLMDGRAHTLTEIATTVHVTPQTTTYHLQGLMGQNLVTMEKAGRFHYFSLASDAVASVFETLSGVAPSTPTSAYAEKRKFAQIDYCRTCYDHLAGQVGVTITDQLLRRAYLERLGNAYAVTAAGRNFFEEQFALDLNELSKLKRRTTTACLDWSERRHHLGGALGHGIFQYLLAHDYVFRGKVPRSVELTAAGKIFLQQALGIAI